MNIKAPRGTEDWLPGRSERLRRLLDIIVHRAQLYGYDEVITPIFEHTELFTRSVGEATDIVQKEMYTFNDKKGRSITLRPEGTASVVRAFLEHQVQAQSQPTKWYYHGPMFRYDKPQAGRLRQFHQFGVEVLGSEAPEVDAEVICLLIDILRDLGLTNYEMHLNSVGCPECRVEYRKALINYIEPFRQQLCADCQRRVDINPLRVLDCKAVECQDLMSDYPPIYDYLCPHCNQHFSQVQALLETVGVKYELDPGLVRGLDYYTQTAFEIHIKGIGAQSAVGGGGRYNGLVSELGGSPMPGIGFAMGLERLLIALELSGVDMTLAPQLDAFICVLDAHNARQGFTLLKELRDVGFRCDQDYNQRGLKAQMRLADKKGARLVIILGEDEIREGTCTIRDMQEKNQETMPRDQVLNYLKSRVGTR
ncbi:MAG: histidine--tRNA ligase [Methylocystaceae bacterium]